MELLVERVKMRNLGVLVLAFICCVLGEVLTSVSAWNCTADSPLVGLSSDLKMVQHQLRGTIEFIDDCTFKVAIFLLCDSLSLHPCVRTEYVIWEGNGTDVELECPHIIGPHYNKML
jgi:hypothetical protein